MSSADIEIQMGPALGIPGKFKAAYNVVEATTPGDPANFIVPVGTELQNVCMVKYMEPFNITSFFGFAIKEPYKTFIRKMHSDHDLKFFVQFFMGLDSKIIDDNNYKSYLRTNHSQFLTEIKQKFKEDIENTEIDDLYDKYDIDDKLFNCVAELAKMHELGIKSLSPKILKIRIVLGNFITINEKLMFTPVYYGIPFDPSSDMSEIKNQIIKLIRKNNESYVNKTITYFQISYLIEKCDDDIVKHYDNIADPEIKPQFLEDMGNAINVFIEQFADETGMINLDFKLANLCPNYSNGNISVNNLDSDPKYLFENASRDPNFNIHAKTFMKFSAFAIVNKYYQIIFPNWFVTQQEVDDMIVFFHDIKYSKYEYNPINMLYYYLVNNKNFLGFTKLLYHYNPLNTDRMLRLKQKFIVPPDVEHKSGLPSIPISGKTGGGSILPLIEFPNIKSSASFLPTIKKGGKKTKRRSSRKRKRRTRKTK